MVEVAHRRCLPAVAGTCLGWQAEEVSLAYAPYFDVRTAGIEEGWALIEGSRK